MPLLAPCPLPLQPVARAPASSSRAFHDPPFRVHESRDVRVHEEEMARLRWLIRVLAEELQASMRSLNVPTKQCDIEDGWMQRACPAAVAEIGPSAAAPLSHCHGTSRWLRAHTSAGHTQP